MSKWPVVTEGDLEKARLKSIAYGLETGYFKDDAPAVTDFATKSADLLRELADRPSPASLLEQVEEELKAAAAEKRRQAFGMDSPAGAEARGLIAAADLLRAKRQEHEAGESNEH